MSDTLDNLFGPLGKEYCVWFYFLSVLGFILLAFLLITSLYYGLSKRKPAEFYFGVFSVAIGYAIFYFQNRLLHSMCMGKM